MTSHTSGPFVLEFWEGGKFCVYFFILLGFDPTPRQVTHMEEHHRSPAEHRKRAR